MSYVLHGFLLGLAYIAPIGTQNLYVIRYALARRHGAAAKVAWIVALADISLATACFYGMSEALQRIPYASTVLALGGSAFLLRMGTNLLRQSASETMHNTDGDGLSDRLWTILKTACAITWLNPQAIVDGSVLLGGVQARLGPREGHLLLLGVGLASVSWFQLLAWVLSVARERINGIVWLWINRICGVGLIAFAANLLYHFFQGA